jgi:hypothetical protein
MNIYRLINIIGLSCPQVVSGHPEVFWIPRSSRRMTNKKMTIEALAKVMKEYNMSC